MASTEERVLLRQELIERTVLGHQQARLVAVPPLVESRSVPVAAWVAFVAICLLWGTTFLGIRVAIETMPTLLVSAFRFTGAGAILLAIAVATSSRFPTSRRDWTNHMLNGVIMSALANSLVVWAEHHISSGLAALLASMIPIWMALLEAMSGSARITTRKVLGLALGFGGVAILVAPAIGAPDVSFQFFLAVGAMQLSAILWNYGTLRSKRYPTTAGPLAAGAVQMLTGGIVAMMVAVAIGTPLTFNFSMRSTLALFYLIVFGSVIAYSAYLYALSKLDAGKLSLYAYVNPAVAVVVGALILHEPLTARMIVSLGIILGGVAIVKSGK